MSHTHEGERKRSAARVVMVLLAVGLALSVAGFFYFHTPRVLQLLRAGDVEGIERYIASAGHRGRIFLIFIQTIETVVIVLPALPVYIAAGVVFGPLQGILLCYLTNVVVNLAMFYVLRRFRVRTADLFPQGRSSRVEKWLSASRHPVRAFFILCLLPILPNGMVTVLATKSTLTLRQYAYALVTGCLPAIAASVLFGDFLMGQIVLLLNAVTISVL